MPEFTHRVTADDAAGRMAVPLPFDPKTEFGRARAPVLVTVDRFAPFPSTTMVYGGQPSIGLRKGQVAEFGLAEGDTITVRVELDTSTRVVEVPSDLAGILDADQQARNAYRLLSYSHQREYVRWITEAKRDATRQTRLARTVELLREGVRTPD